MRNKLLLSIAIAIIVGAVLATYLRYIYFQDYVIELSVPCDPASESCFVYICDPEEEECTGNAEEDTSYYKLVARKAYNIPYCDQESNEDCGEIYTCSGNEADCEIILCNEETVEDGEVCTNSEDFVETGESSDFDLETIPPAGEIQ